MKAFFLPLSFVCLFTVSKAQETVTKEAPASSTLLHQFNTLKNKSNTYQGHKVIEIGKLDAFWKNVQDAVKETENKLANARSNAEKELVQVQAELKEQEALVTSLKQENALKEQEVQKSIHDINHLSVLGIDMQKQTYVIASFAIIFSLIIALGAIIMRYKASLKYSKEKQQDFEEIEQEYADYKKAAWEKEIKLKRELQTELNRVEDLSNELDSYKKHISRAS